jgi:hypothetical protein
MRFLTPRGRGRALQEEAICVFYMRTGYCKYGRMCKFHHPNLTAANAPLPTHLPAQQPPPPHATAATLGDHDRTTPPPPPPTTTTKTPAAATSASVSSGVESTATMALVAPPAMQVVDVASVSPHLVQVNTPALPRDRHPVKT